MKLQWLEKILNFDHEKRINELLKIHSMTMAQLCEKCADLGDSTLPALFKNKERIPNLRTIAYVCFAFDMTLDEYFEEPGIESLSPFEQELFELLRQLPPDILMHLWLYLKFTLDPNRK